MYLLGLMPPSTSKSHIDDNNNKCCLLYVNLRPPKCSFKLCRGFGSNLVGRANCFFVVPIKHFLFVCGLKTLDTIGNCQRSVFSLCVSQHMHKISNLWTGLNWSSKLRENKGRNNTIAAQSVCFQLRSRIQLLLYQKLRLIFRGSLF